VLVRLDEGCQMISNVIDCPRERLAIDLPVEAVFDRLSDQVALPKFRPVDARLRS
jgi:hypothetical protein